MIGNVKNVLMKLCLWVLDGDIYIYIYIYIYIFKSVFDDFYLFNSF